MAVEGAWNYVVEKTLLAPFFVVEKEIFQPREWSNSVVATSSTTKHGIDGAAMHLAPNGTAYYETKWFICMF